MKTSPRGSGLQRAVIDRAANVIASEPDALEGEPDSDGAIANVAVVGSGVVGSGVVGSGVVGSGLVMLTRTETEAERPRCTHPACHSTRSSRPAAGKRSSRGILGALSIWKNSVRGGRPPVFWALHVVDVWSKMVAVVGSGVVGNGVVGSGVVGNGVVGRGVCVSVESANGVEESPLRMTAPLSPFGLMPPPIPPYLLTETFIVVLAGAVWATTPHA